MARTIVPEKYLRLLKSDVSGLNKDRVSKRKECMSEIEVRGKLRINRFILGTFVFQKCAHLAAYRVVAHRAVPL